MISEIKKAVGKKYPNLIKTLKTHSNSYILSNWNELKGFTHSDLSTMRNQLNLPRSTFNYNEKRERIFAQISKYVGKDKVSSFVRKLNSKTDREICNEYENINSVARISRWRNFLGAPTSRQIKETRQKK